MGVFVFVVIIGSGLRRFVRVTTRREVRIWDDVFDELPAITRIFRIELCINDIHCGYWKLNTIILHIYCLVRFGSTHRDYLVIG